MATCEFHYHRPATLAEACALPARLGEGAFYLAGGTELLPDFRRGAETAAHLISLRDVRELSGIAMSGGRLRIGAMTTIREVGESDEVRRALPALAEAARSLGSPQIRSLATIGGNFCRAVPCADTPPPCIVAEATVRLASASGRRELPAERLFAGPRRTVLEPGEILVDVIVPSQPRHSGVSYQRFALRRGSALAVASVAVRLVLDGDRIAAARIALGSVAPVPMAAPRAASLLEGRPANAETFARAAREAADEARPIADLRGTEAFRRHLVEVLSRRAFAEAALRARERDA